MNILTAGDAWAAEVGAHSAAAQSSPGRKEKTVLWDEEKKKEKKGLLVLSVTPAGSYRSVFKPTGLPWTALLNSRFSNRKQWRSEVA